MFSVVILALVKASIIGGISPDSAALHHGLRAARYSHLFVPFVFFVVQCFFSPASIAIFTTEMLTVLPLKTSVFSVPLCLCGEIRFYAVRGLSPEIN